MKLLRFLSRAGLALALCHLVVLPAAAQAMRTWVSGVGDDVNPGSRTAPSKTFAGAIARTAAGGEINCLDAAGFGAVTITKSITIDGGGTLASVLNLGTNGITIDGAGVVVTLRNLSIHGAGRGLSGIKLLKGAVLNVENCVISGQTGRGIDVTPGQNAKVFIKDTIIRGNDHKENGGGIRIAPEPTFSVTAVLDNVRLEGNLFGLSVSDRVTATVRNSTATGNVADGFLALGSADPVSLNLENCLVSGNGSIGIRNAGKTDRSVIRLSNVTVVQNLGGLDAAGDSLILSFGNNRIAGNGVENNPTATLPLQ
jgi:hypothetical protein